MKLANFIGAAYTLESPNVDCQACRNLFPEIDEMQTGKDAEVASLVSTPGLRLWKTVGTGPIRELYLASNGRVFCVSGSELYESNGTDAPVKRGDLVTASGPVSMTDNGVQLFFVDGPKGYIFTFADNTFAQITDEEFFGGTMAGFLDGYFLTNEPNTQRFWISSQYDGTSWDGLDFGAAEGLPDNVLALIVQGREVILMGDRSTEFWFDSGDANFPLARIQGAFIECGIEAPYSLKKFDNSVMWLGRDLNGHRMFFRANGYNAQRVSTHAVEQAIQRYGDVSRMSAFTYQMDGHTFYVANFEGANTSWVYDAATNLWHERTYTNAQGQQERHRADCHVFVGSTHYVGDYQNSNVYILTPDEYSDNGASITRERTTTHTSNDGKRMFFSRLEIFAQAGIGTETGQGQDPKLMLSWSDDGGHTWSDERVEAIGKMGEYKHRARWNRLGSSRDRVWKVRFTDPNRLRLISASVEVQGGNS